jgi:hypothetical protein
MPVILATQEAEISRIVVQSQPGQIVHETLAQKNPSQKRAGGAAPGGATEFKAQYCQKKKKTKNQKTKQKKSIKAHRMLLYLISSNHIYMYVCTQSQKFNLIMETKPEMKQK